MADYLKSAFNYFSNVASSKVESDFVGGSIHVGPLSLRIKRTIAEGGFGVVYEAQDVTKGETFALKRMISQGKENSETIIREIKFLKLLTGHPNIIAFYQAASLSADKTKSSRTEYLLVTEFCKAGQLNQYLPVPRQEPALPVDVITQIMHQTCRAVQHMHDQCPSVIHRDLKIENLLLSEDFIIKLCDFGSASTELYNPDSTWNALKRLTVQEELEKFTTPMYRPPELLDLYLNYPIGTPSDVWALGCILFYLCCTHHPFEDSAKLAILNANYSLPSTPSSHTVFHNLIRQMLLIDPRQRPTVTEVLGELSELASAREVSVSGSIPLLKEAEKRKTHASFSDPTVSNNEQVQRDGANPSASPTQPQPKPFPSRPPAPSQQREPTLMEPRQLPVNESVPSAKVKHVAPNEVPEVRTSASGSGAASVLGLLRGGAGSLMKNIRDASSKVLESVSATFSGELDFQLITSRVAVMPFPAESGMESFAHSNSIEEVQAFLDSHYPNSYAIYNLSPRSYRSDQWFDGRVSHRVFDPHKAPSLRSLIELCLNARLWLHQNPGNVCVVHCTDGRAASAVFVCSLFCFCHLFDNASPAIQLFSSKRGNPRLNASQIRYIDYVAQLAHGRAPMPHRRPLQLIRLTVSPIPTFNKAKTGCRPYIEVYEGKSLILSTFTSYESLRSYVLEDGKIEFALNGASVMGDLTVIVFHCRSSFTGRGKLGSVKIAQFQLYTGMIEPDQTELIYFKSDLDHLDSSTSFSTLTSRYADSFHLNLEFMVSPTDRPRHKDELISPWDTFPSANLLRPQLCVSNDIQLRCIMEDFGRFNISPSAKQSDYKPSTVKSENQINSKPGTHGVSAVSTKPLKATRIEEPGIQDVESNNVTKEATRVADLLGFSDKHSDSLPGDAQPNGSLRNPILIDITPAAEDPSVSNPKKNHPFVDDLLGFTPSNGNIAADWPTNAFATDATTTPHAQSKNPFDPFASPTGDASEFFSTDHVTRSREESSVDLDQLFERHAPMSTSASATDLSSTKFAGLHPSSSYASLLTNGTSAPTSKPVSMDPFADLSDLFGRSHGVPTTDPSNDAQRKSERNENPRANKRIPQSSPTNRGSAPNVNTSSDTESKHSRTGARPRVEKDAFSDLLGGFGSSSTSSSQPLTVNDMRRQQLEKTTDPEQLKVLDWAHGKDRNVRALLCSLPSILWEGVRWKPVSLADLMNPEQVKRQYRNAARAVHPDKWMNTEKEKLARMIFVELNDAMTEFEKDPNAILSL